MWFTFKTIICALFIWQFIEWRFHIWRRKRRLRDTTVKRLTPSEAAQRISHDNTINAVNDNSYDPPSTAQAIPIVAQQVTPTPRNNKMINDVISAMVNLGMAKRKAKQHVNMCYDKMVNNPSLNELLTYSIQSLTT